MHVYAKSGVKSALRNINELSEIVDSGNLLSAISHILTKGRSKNIIIKGSNNESI